MIARPKSSKACSIGSISREQVSHGTSTGPYASRNSFTAAAIYGANVVVLQPNVVSISSSFVWKAEIFQNVQLQEGVDGSIWSHQMTFFLLYEYRPIPPLSRHHIDPVPEYSKVGGSHHLIAGQSVFHLDDQGCSALSSWRQHIASVRPASFYAP